MQRFQEWKHPLKQILPEMDRSTQEKLIDCWRMRERMWEHHILSADRGGHLRGTLDTWPLLGNVLRLSHIPLGSSVAIDLG